MYRIKKFSRLVFKREIMKIYLIRSLYTILKMIILSQGTNHAAYRRKEKKRNYLFLTEIQILFIQPSFFRTYPIYLIFIIT